MASYNRIFGEYACENSYLLKDILRDEWKYDGCVISDWGACLNLPKAISSGMDLEMPTSLGLHIKDAINAYNDNELKDEDINRAYNNITKLINDYDISNKAVKKYDSKSIALSAVEEGAILLKNDDNILPLNKNEKLIVIGRLSKDIRYQGGGSSNVNAIIEYNILDILKDNGIDFKYFDGYKIKDEEIDENLENEALNNIDSNSKIIYVMGLTVRKEGEGYDRVDMKLPINQKSLLEKIGKINNNIICVSLSGSPYEIDNIDNIKAFLQMYLAGQELAKGVFNLLYGVKNPSGRLSETWPIKYEDVLSSKYFDKISKDLEYRESIFVGYRYFNSYNIKTLFPFGYGLSYTKFSYSDLKLNKFDILNRYYEVLVKVKNIGERSGGEVIQVYVENPKSNYLRAKRELRGFEKVFLEKGEEKEVSIILDENAFSIFDENQNKFIQPSGKYKILINKNVEEVILEREIDLIDCEYNRDDRNLYEDFFNDNEINISKKCFRNLYGKDLSDFNNQNKNGYSMYSSLDELASVSNCSKIFRYFIVKEIYKMFSNRDKDDPQVRMMIEGATTGPIDALICQSNIPYLRNVGEFLIDIANKKGIKSISKLFKS